MVRIYFFIHEKTLWQSYIFKGHHITKDEHKIYKVCIISKIFCNRFFSKRIIWSSTYIYVSMERITDYELSKLIVSMREDLVSEPRLDSFTYGWIIHHRNRNFPSERNFSRQLFQRLIKHFRNLHLLKDRMSCQWCILKYTALIICSREIWQAVGTYTSRSRNLSFS